ncbi:MFS transporter [Candidatus Marsarchaeota archaeon]|nr:MFS transporter [Candidatus Marsarchaeota archaeon]
MKNDLGFKFLLYSRISRSMAIIYMTLASPLYLSLINISLPNIGLIYLGIMVFSSVLSLSLGVMGDRIGFRKALMISELPPILGLLILWLTTNVYLITFAVIIGGIGGLAGGLRGSFSPGLSAFTANNYKDEKERVKKLSLLNRASSIGSIIGAILLMSHSLLQSFFGGVYAYRLLFLLAAILMLFSLISLYFVQENARPKKSTRVMKKESSMYVLRIAALNALNGSGLGISLPLLPLLFSLAFGLPNDTTALYIGLIYIPSYIATALGSHIAHKVHFKSGILAIASRTRMLGGFLLIAMGTVFAMQYTRIFVFLPLLGIAALLYSIRSFIAGIGSPSVITVNIKGVHVEDYGTASSIQGLSGTISQSSIGAGGYLIEYALPMPLFVGGALQLASGFLYPKLLGRYFK